MKEMSKYETAPIFEHATSTIAIQLSTPTIAPIAIAKSVL